MKNSGSVVKNRNAETLLRAYALNASRILRNNSDDKCEQR